VDELDQAAHVAYFDGCAHISAAHVQRLTAARRVSMFLLPNSRTSATMALLRRLLLKIKN
jgi:hypothetical protein